MNAVVEPHAPPQAMQPQERPLTVIEHAIRSGATADQLERLLELQVRADNHQLELMREKRRMDEEDRKVASKNAYYEAMSKFKAKGVRVLRDKDIKDGPLKGKKHATVSSVANAANAALSEFGLSAAWRPLAEEKDWIRLSCVITHKDGYSEEASFGGPIDTGPGRNAIQARKSTVSYLERITMELVLGLAEHDDDDDGRGAGNDISRGATKTDEASAEIRAALVQTGNDKAMEGMAPLTAWWGTLTAKQRTDLTKDFAMMRRAAQVADRAGQS